MQGSATYSRRRYADALVENFADCWSALNHDSSLLMDRLLVWSSFQQKEAKLNPGFLSKEEFRLGDVFINITPDTEGGGNKELKSQHVSSVKASVFCSPSENTLLIGFRYLQNDLFNGITTRIMILFMREAIQALRQADNAFPALWQLMLCYRGR